MSRRIRTLIALALFMVSYLAVYWLWGKAWPAYGRFLAAASDGFVNAVATTGTSYKIDFVDSSVRVQTRVAYGPPGSEKGRNSQRRGRPINEVSYNLCLWAALCVATLPFVNSSSRWRFVLIGLILMIFWHVCDVAIYAKNCRWMLLESLHQDFPELVSDSSVWPWFWNRALVLNIRIIAPLLPMFLWILFCSRSFFAPTEKNRSASRFRLKAARGSLEK